MKNQIFKIFVIVEFVFGVLFGRYLLVGIQKGLPPRNKQLKLKTSRFSQDPGPGYRIKYPLQINEKHKLPNRYRSFGSHQLTSPAHIMSPRMPLTSQASDKSYAYSEAEMEEDGSLASTGTYFLA